MIPFRPPSCPVGKLAYLAGENDMLRDSMNTHTHTHRRVSHNDWGCDLGGCCLIFIHCLLLSLTFLIEDVNSYHNFAFKSPDFWCFFLNAKLKLGKLETRPPPSQKKKERAAHSWEIICLCYLCVYLMCFHGSSVCLGVYVWSHRGLCWLCEGWTSQFSTRNCLFVRVEQINGKSLSLLRSCRDAAHMCFGMWVCGGF